VAETRYIGRANLTKRLTALEGQVGRTRYRDGSACLELAGGMLTVTPPFGLGHEGEYDRVVVGPLLEALGEDTRWRRCWSGSAATRLAPS
jgi:hypothetical protein